MLSASEICTKATELMNGDRAKTHGDMRLNHETIAAFWDAYLVRRAVNDPSDPNLMQPLSCWDVANMMELLKIARRLTGRNNPEDYIDAVGYAAIAGQLASD